MTILLVKKLVSGGQTGADRGGMDAARDLAVPFGGWAPQGYRAEDGVIPEVYARHMREAGTSRLYSYRTRLNVQDSDGTLIVSLGPLPVDSGSMLTSKLARQIGKPLLALRVEQLRHPIGQSAVRGWLDCKAIRVLNIAGPRESREPGIQAATRDVLVAILSDRAPR